MKAWILLRASGIFECRNKPAPFLTASGRPYLEVHHLIRLIDDGPVSTPLSPSDPLFLSATDKSGHGDPPMKPVSASFLAFVTSSVKCLASSPVTRSSIEPW